MQIVKTEEIDARMMIQSQLTASEPANLDNIIMDTRKHRLAKLYTEHTPEAFARDDTLIMPLIEEDAPREQGRRWLMNEAPFADSFTHSQGGEVINADGHLGHNFRCWNGELVSFTNLSFVSEALARRVCAKRADPYL